MPQRSTHRRPSLHRNHHVHAVGVADAVVAAAAAAAAADADAAGEGTSGLFEASSVYRPVGCSRCKMVSLNVPSPSLDNQLSRSCRSLLKALDAVSTRGSP